MGYMLGINTACLKKMENPSFNPGLSVVLVMQTFKFSSEADLQHLCGGTGMVMVMMMMMC